MSRADFRARAYTLIELTVALVMAAIVSTAGMSAFAMFNRHRVRIERASTADDVAKTVLQYMIRETQRIGGSALRPWQAIAVEQDPCGQAGTKFDVPCEDGGDAGLGPDRVTFAFADDAAVFSGCPVIEITDSQIKFNKESHEGHVDKCCNQYHFNAENDVVIAPVSELANQHIMLSSTGTAGTLEEIYKAVTYSSSPGGADCTFNYVQSGQAFPLASVPRPDKSKFAPPPGSTAFIKTFANAIPIKIATAYVGCSTPSCVGRVEDRAIFLFSDRNAGAGTVARLDSTDDNFVLSPNVVDLQVALGYDNDEDGEVVESESGESDDFAGNVSTGELDTGFSTATASLATGETVLVGDADDEAAPTALTSPNPRLLRMLRIGVISAVKVNDRGYQTTAQLPGGGELGGNGLHVRAVSSKAAFRSLNLLE
ncbi:MAG: type II secretion system protein [Deltaproteobacteria bacterium]|nr:type II secretion system protein [Deltaproteobacteria bacterium]